MMGTLRVCFERLPMARWAGMFQILLMERDLTLDWEDVGFPTADRPLLDGFDAGIFVQPPSERGLSALTLEKSGLVVLMAAGHPLAERTELKISDILDEPFPGDANHHPRWRAFWTLDDYRGGPPKVAEQSVEDAEDGLRVIAAGEAIATLPAATADSLGHPGVVAMPLVDGPMAHTELVWHRDDSNPDLHALIEVARAFNLPLPEPSVSR